jgi:DNA-directed RNA polymerase subunit M/transcription elongation factor TFIIS
VTAVQCSECGSLILEEELDTPDFRECTGCGRMIRVRIFPAYRRTNAAAKTESVIEGESGCFFHPKKQAVVPCDECGRFLCGLCRVEFGSRNICPGCIDAGMQKRKLPALEMTRTRYDSVALAVATLPALLIWPSLLSAPIALYLVIRHWNDPASIIPRSRWRFVIAFLFALIQLGTWLVIVLFLIANRNRLSV